MLPFLICSGYFRPGSGLTPTFQPHHFSLISYFSFHILRSIHEFLLMSANNRNSSVITRLLGQIPLPESGERSFLR